MDNLGVKYLKLNVLKQFYWK